MVSKERQLEPMDRTLNPENPLFGMPWYAILGIIVFALVLFFVPFPGFKVVGAFFAPTALFFGWWLCKDDPKEPQLLIHDIVLPGEFDPGK
jgi:hypothetical protein